MSEVVDSKMKTTLKKNFEQQISNYEGRSTAEELKYNGSIEKLLVSYDETIEDKIATLKTAQIVDKGRFEIAFKTLMKR